MQRFPQFVLLLQVIALNGTLSAQAARNSPTDSTAAARRAIELAESGHCPEALPELKRLAHTGTDKDLKRRAGLNGVRCAMGMGRSDDALEFLRALNREFPADPDVLYLSIHTFSDLATRASEELARSAPSSYQARELNAEAYETQGKWDKATQEYQKALAQNPDAPGIHFRLGRLLLSKPNPPADVVERARKEFQAELKIDPSNAGAEYVLGELARQDQNWDDAVKHFSRASKLDPAFGDAFLGLGEALISSRKFPEAIPPLQTAVKLEPGNPAAHYNLATAYSRAGRKAEADKEFAIHRQMTQKEPGQNPASQDNPPANPN
ncbi:MAG: tetratricopeptide repeat protein [Terriglobales bacterium]